MVEVDKKVLIEDPTIVERQNFMRIVSNGN
jgi:hypothetical protein